MGCDNTSYGPYEPPEIARPNKAKRKKAKKARKALLKLVAQDLQDECANRPCCTRWPHP